MVLKVDGMSCEHCVRRVKEAVLEAGAASCEVDLENGTVTVELGDAEAEAIVEAIEDAGYDVEE